MSLTTMRPGITFSVIVPVFQQPATAKMVLQCLQEQQDAPDFEVIVCDDGSTPETFHACQDLIRNAAMPIYWAWQQDRGFHLAKSRNNGIRMASGRYLLLLDGDHVPERDLLARHFQLHTRPGLLVHGIRRWRSLEVADAAKPDGAAAIWQLLRGDAAVNQAVRDEQEEAYRNSRFIVKRGKPWRLVMGTNLSIERREDVYLDEEFTGWGIEDLELGYRLVEKQGFEMIYVRDLICYQLQAAVNNPAAKGSHESIVGTMRNVVHFIEKWPEMQAYKSHSMLRRVNLNQATDLWSLSSSDSGPEETAARYDQACDWLRRHGQFPRVQS